MSYIALARKWRPRTFSQLVGQEHINRALINSLNQERIHHAYLFTGTRGVGKTSVARLFAKALNCEQGIRAEPCLSCETCLAIEQGRFVDLIEIDGASRTRVEDTREVLDNVQYAATSGRFKIYLIDEVHMLSQHSFNALLKTLEEPPAHVKFLLATTDPQKLPVTVLSRCLQFSLKHIQPEVIATHLQTILTTEKILFEANALMLIAKAAQGSMRDALSLLDQAIASMDKTLTQRDIQLMLGYTQHDYALQLLQALANLEINHLITISRKIETEGGHFRYVLDELLNYLHHIALVQAMTEPSPFLMTTAEITALSKQFSPEDVQLFYQICLKGAQDLGLAPTPALGFEMLMLRLYAFRPAPFLEKEPTFAYQSLAKSQEQDHSAERKKELSKHQDRARDAGHEETLLNHQEESHDAGFDESLLKHQQETPEYQEMSYNAHYEETLLEHREELPAYQEMSRQAQHDKPSEGDQSVPNWGNLLPLLKLTGLALTAAENAEVASFDGTILVLQVAKGHLSLFTALVIQKIEQGLTTYYKKVIKLKLQIQEMVPSTPATQRQEVQIKRQAQAEAALQNDTFFQQLQREFSAELVKNSVTALKEEL